MRHLAWQSTTRARTLSARLPAIVALLASAAGAVGCGETGPAAAVGEAVTLATSGATHPTVDVTPDGGAAYAAWVGRDPRPVVGDEATRAGESDGDAAVEPGTSTGVAGDAAASEPDGTASGADAWNVYFSRMTADGADSSEPVRVNDLPGDAAPHAQAPAQVAVGPEGAVYVAWQTTTEIEGRRFPASDLRLARSDDGGRTFSPAVYVNDDAGHGEPTSHTFHDIAVAGDGTVFVSWIDGRNDESAGPQIRVARSDDGGRSFSPGTIVDGDACPCCRTSLAVGRDGRVYVAWRKVYDGDVRDIVVARSTDGGDSFSTPTRVHEDGWVIAGCPHAGPSVAVDAGGRVHLTWYTGAEGGTGLFHAVAAAPAAPAAAPAETGMSSTPPATASGVASTDAALRFGEPTPLTDREFVPPSQARLAAAADGRVWVAWEDRAADGTRIRLAEIPADGERISESGIVGRGVVPAIAAGRDGAAAVAWLDGESARAAAARRDSPR